MGDESGIVARWCNLMAAVIDPELHRSELAVLAVILDRMDKGGIAWPSLSTIATDAKVSRGQVIKVLPKLRDRGYLLVESGTQVASNRYRLGPTGRRPQESRGSRVQEPTGRRPQASGVDASKAVQVGAHRRPEPALRATNSIEPKKSTRSRAPLLTYREWIHSLKAEDDPTKAVPEGDPIFEFQEKAGISDDFLYLAWRWFGHRFRDDDRKYRDWRAVFRRCIREDWHRCWRKDNGTGQFVLTTVGLQLQDELAAEEAEA